jgi:hypothetical protein
LHVTLGINNAVKCLTNDSCISADCWMPVTCQSSIASAEHEFAFCITPACYIRVYKVIYLKRTL